VGRGGIALRIHVVSKGRALPRAWRVREGPKGHVPEALPIALVERVRGLLPEGAPGVFLGDGACDGTRLQHTVPDAGGSSVCRTGCHLPASWEGEPCRLDTVGACRKPGTLVALSEGLFPREHSGPIRLLCCWAKGEKDPIYVVTNMASAEEACRV
jgi:hypothetical protein